MDRTPTRSDATRTRTSAQRTGDAAETLVGARLARDGWTILGRNVHVARNEVDIVAVDPAPPAALVIVEVRWRRRSDFGLAEETVDWRKRGRLHRAGFALVASGRLPDGTRLPRLPLRFDLVVVEPGADGVHARMRHHRAAF